MIEEKLSKKIREIRNEKKITLKDLSEKTQLSVSFLSQIERGISSMTLSTLKKIADALDTQLKDLLDVEEKNSFVMNKNNPALIKLKKSYTGYIRLSGKFEGRKLESFILTMEAGFCDNECMSHQGEEFYYVLKGKATFVVQNIEYDICEGESIHFPSMLMHKVINKEDVELVMLCTVTPLIF